MANLPLNLSPESASEIALGTNAVVVIDGQPMASSYEVAQTFQKHHKDVLRRIESMDCSPEFRQRNFALSEQTMKNGNITKQIPYYRMTFDGFVFLVGSFTGKKAAAFKEAYIARFNWMREELIRRQLEAERPTPHKPAQAGLFEFQFKGKRFRILFASGQLMYSSEDAMQILGRAGEPSESAFIRKMAKQQDAWNALVPGTQQHLAVFSELAFMELLNTASHQTANDVLVWLNDEVRPVLYTGQTAGLSQQPNPEQALRAVLEGKRFICAFDHEQRLTLRELTQEERILSPEKLPQWIADPFGAPFSCLPEVLRAATERLISGRRRPNER